MKFQKQAGRDGSGDFELTAGDLPFDSSATALSPKEKSKLLSYLKEKVEPNLFIVALAL